MVSIALGCPTMRSLQSPNQSQVKILMVPSYEAVNTFFPFFITITQERSSEKLSDIA